MPRRAKDLRSSLVASGVLLRDQRLEHLDDGDLGAEALEDRGELTADDPAAQDDQPLGTSVWASRPVESTQRGDRGPGWAA